MLRPLKLLVVFVLSLLALGGSSARAEDASFCGLGFLSPPPQDDWPQSCAYGVSANGLVIVGDSWSGSDFQACAWVYSAQGRCWQIMSLGDLPGGFVYSSAAAASGNGSVIVGMSDSTSGNEAFRWASEGGMAGLADGGFQSQAYGVSADGSVVVGVSQSGSGWEAFRWTSDRGMVGLGDLPDGRFWSEARAVSADGSAIVGTGESISGTEAFRWTFEGGMAGLGDLPDGGFQSQAYGVSADGSAVVGVSQSGRGWEAFRWTSEGGMVGLGDLPGGSFWSEAYGVSGDGSVVVGASYSAYTSDGCEAFIWTPETGMRSLKTVLTNEHGLDLTGWTLESAEAVSADGRTIVGIGINPDGWYEAWVAVLPRTVQDTTPPELTVPEDLLIEQDSADGTAVTWECAATDDGGGSVTVDCIPLPGSVFPLGQTEVTCTASDGAGNQTVKSFTVTVRDTIPPILLPPADLTGERAIEQTSRDGTPVAIGEAVFSDLCDAAVTITNDAPGVFPLGTTLVTWAAVDASGNAATGTQRVTVTDTTPPALVAPPDVTVEEAGPSGTPVDLGVAMVGDVCDASIAALNDSPGLFPVGTTIVRWTATDGSGNRSTAEQRVTVVATSPVGQLEDLAELIQTAAEAGEIAPDLERSLTAKVRAALATLALGGPKSARTAGNQLGAFINQVKAQAGKKIARDVAAQLIESAQQVQAALTQWP